ncbi:hypothetical protein HDU84_008446 [Entophlyctis sp. JEL0112]|nr:hypothetical protein HDU84_008446 [Entophlyctis sp. JEL0112]
MAGFAALLAVTLLSVASAQTVSQTDAAAATATVSAANATTNSNSSTVVSASRSQSTAAFSFQSPSSAVCSGSSFCVQFAVSNVRPTATASQSSVSTDSDSIAAQAQVVAVLVETTFSGYIALGFGGADLASSSDIVVVWNNSALLVKDEASVLSVANASAQVEIDQMNVTERNAVFGSILTQNKASLAAFLAPLTFFADSGPTQFCYALSTKAGTDSGSLPAPDGPSGAFAYDVGVAGTAAGASSLLSTAVVAHAAVMFIAWGVLPYLIVANAPFLKFKFEKAWRLFHLLCSVVGIFGLTVAGILLISVGRGSGLAVFAGSAHGVLGSVLAYIGLPILIISGMMSHILFSPGRWSTPVRDYIHWILGGAVTIIAAADIYLGLQAANLNSNWVIAFAVWFTLMFLVVAAGHTWSENVKRQSIRKSAARSGLYGSSANVEAGSDHTNFAVAQSAQQVSSARSKSVPLGSHLEVTGNIAPASSASRKKTEEPKILIPAAETFRRDRFKREPLATEQRSEKLFVHWFERKPAQESTVDEPLYPTLASSSSKTTTLSKKKNNDPVILIPAGETFARESLGRKKGKNNKAPPLSPTTLHTGLEANVPGEIFGKRELPKRYPTGQADTNTAAPEAQVIPSSRKGKEPLVIVDASISVSATNDVTAVPGSVEKREAKSILKKPPVDSNSPAAQRQKQQSLVAARIAGYEEKGPK